MASDELSCGFGEGWIVASINDFDAHLACRACHDQSGPVKVLGVEVLQLQFRGLEHLSPGDLRDLFLGRFPGT